MIGAYLWPGNNAATLQKGPATITSTTTTADHGFEEQALPLTIIILHSVRAWPVTKIFANLFVYLFSAVLYVIRLLTSRQQKRRRQR